ncbi:Endoglucanase-5 [Dactylella cylindrospora]|nr:Endoglucanase-5 [Dactylella cylindrospora]
MALLKAAFVLSTIPYILAADVNILSGTGSTGLYWDCCKPSCAWPEKGPWLTHPVDTCNKDDSPLEGFTAGSACGQGGTAYVCNDQQPWAVNDTFSYGFISAYIVGATEFDWCCSCYELNFINNGVAGKRMIVQASNTGYDDPSRNIFGVGAPGEVDYADGCLNRYDGAGNGFLGKMGNRVTSREDCEELPEPLQSGCFWRFDWFNDSFKPNMTFQRVKCPTELTDKTGCIRNDEDNFNVTASSGASIVSFSGSGSTGLLTISMILAVFALGFGF